MTPRRSTRTSWAWWTSVAGMGPRRWVGVVGDVVAGDVRVVGVGDVVDLQAAVEVGKVDVPVVGGQAGQALLLVLVVRAGPAALGAKAGRVVAGRGPGRGNRAIRIGSVSSEMSTVATWPAGSPQSSRSAWLLMTTMSRPGSGTAECPAMVEPSGGETGRVATCAGWWLSVMSRMTRPPRIHGQ